MKLFYFILCLTCSGMLEASEDGLFSSAPKGIIQPQFLPVDDAFALSAQFEGNSLILRWQVQPNYYLYRHRLSVASEPEMSAKIGSPVIPSGLKRSDEYFGDVEVYYDELVLDVPVLSKSTQIQLEVGYQGCADAGLCYPPQIRHFHFKTSEPGIQFPTESDSKLPL